MTSLEWILAVALLLMHLLGGIYNFVCYRSTLRETAGFVGYQLLPAWKKYLLPPIISFFWEIIGAWVIWEEIVLAIAEAKYRSLFLRGKHINVVCVPDFQPMSDGTGLVCDACGYFIEDSQLEDNGSLEYYNKKHLHLGETAEMRKFKKSFWYRQLVTEYGPNFIGEVGW